jgi:hypothetical protein
VNLELNPKHELSVIGHELWHFVGAANTRVKSELLLEAISSTLKLGKTSEFPESYNENLVPLWESLAYQAQLSRSDTPHDLKAAIIESLTDQPELAVFVDLVGEFEKNVLGNVKKISTLTQDILTGYLYQTIDVLHRLGVTFEEVSRVFRDLFLTPPRSIPELPTVTSLTSFISEATFSHLTSGRPDAPRWKIVDLADTRRTFAAPVGEEKLKTMDYVMQEVLYAEAIREAFEEDEQELLSHYAFSILDDFGVGCPIRHVTVDSLDAPNWVSAKIWVHSPDKKAMFLRLGEHIRKTGLYLRRRAAILAPSTEKRISAYLRFLKSLRELGPILQDADMVRGDDCERRAYLHLKKNLPAADDASAALGPAQRSV